MSRNALALVDCSNREKLFHFLINTFDRKCTKKEMISPYDDQLIGKMNFRYSGTEHAMFFTYARSSEYPGMKFRNHKVIYLSLDVNDISSDIFNRICTRFGGYIIHNDDLETGWEKIERQQPDNDDDLSLSEEIVAERHFLFDTEEEQEKKVYREIKVEPDVEEEKEEREWAPPVTEVKEPKQEKKQNSSRNGRNHRGSRQEAGDSKEKHDMKEKHEQKDKHERQDKQEKAKTSERKDGPKITVSETLRSHERQKEQKEAREQKKAARKNENKHEVKNEIKNNAKPPVKESDKESGKESDKEKSKSSHRRGHRGGRKHSGKNAGKEGIQQNSEKPAYAKTAGGTDQPQQIKQEA